MRSHPRVRPKPLTNTELQIKGNYEKSFRFQEPSNTRKGIIVVSLLGSAKCSFLLENFFFQKRILLLNGKEFRCENDRVTAQAVIRVGQSQFLPSRQLSCLVRRQLNSPYNVGELPKNIWAKLLKTTAQAPQRSD